MHGTGRVVRRIRLALGGVALGALGAATAFAQAPTLVDDPGYQARSYLVAHGRGLDQARHPDYQQRMLPGYQDGAQAAPGWMKSFGTDPYLAEDGPRRADWREVTFTNRYGARLTGTLIAPREAGRHPAIVIEPGGTGPRYGYLNIAQGLAESGYVTLIIAAQGDAEADADPADPVPATPQNEYCRPYDHGHWQEGEGGVPERGDCAGREPDLGPGSPTDLPLLLAGDDLAHSPGLREAYRAVRARKAFGVLDAVRYLASDANPWRCRVDASRIGAAGHSFGAHGAMVAGQTDSRHQIDAVVAWDGYGPLDGIAPRVPTMFQNSEERMVGPHWRRRDPDDHPQATIETTFQHAGVPSMLVTLAGSTHQEWNYLPYAGIVAGVLVLNQDPLGAEEAPASRLGERVALYYTLAWFDRWLKPGARMREDARRRLLASRFDATADRVAIGQGRWDPVTRTNVPYLIAGRSVRRRLSPEFTSRADFDGITCPDLRAGC